MRAEVRRVSMITVTVAVFAFMTMGIAMAHTPHAPSVGATWSTIHLTGYLNGVTHTGANTFSSWSRSSYSHTHEYEAWVYWADRHCAGACWWHTHASKYAINNGTSATTGTLQFTADLCRYYKFYSEHRNQFHSTSKQILDEGQGVQRFQAGNC